MMTDLRSHSAKFYQLGHVRFEDSFGTVQVQI